ncbi:Thioesterase/thiol ester dehydrase-isomerase [Laetiporus sulphureus 93-53]|uniref:Thioesterase/thiol ester dehydrase-isomerase n=1 Tax=Laetiporus sulphureus 93-53 TaxID=1314785 RepID=A0A165AV56_9APHY|nr:Thioesterase/thiol ester dehydrase-isomerase [Laetiporus sulphureus 93-53]KZS99723.1 Thioesterase/thiol ester dehydrase-isomerase [Laetiporus sulphureus 93-53]
MHVVNLSPASRHPHTSREVDDIPDVIKKISLQDAFRDPSSPFHLPPGTQGPASPDPPAEFLHTEAQETRAEHARTKMLELGYDPSSFWEQRIVWGDHDAFQHVNNVRYVRFLESSRIEWMVSLGKEIGGASRADDMLAGRGISLILKTISIDYKRPVVYPDMLLIAHKPHPGPLVSTSDVHKTEFGQRRFPKTHFHLMGAIYSYAQRRIVTECDEVLVWYDYEKLAKCDPGEEATVALQRRMFLTQEPSAYE